MLKTEHGELQVDLSQQIHRKLRLVRLLKKKDFTIKCQRVSSCILWSPYVIGQTIIFSSCFFPLSSSSFFPRLISAVGDWMFTILWHMVWP